MRGEQAESHAHVSTHQTTFKLNELMVQLADYSWEGMVLAVRHRQRDRTKTSEVSNYLDQYTGVVHYWYC